MRTNQKLRVSTIKKIGDRIQVMLSSNCLKEFANSAATEDVIDACEFKLDAFDYTTNEFCITCTMDDDLFLKYNLALIKAQSRVSSDYAKPHRYFKYNLPAGFLDLYNLIMRCMFNYFDMLDGIRINFRSKNECTMTSFRYDGIQLGYYDNDDSDPSDITGLGLDRPYGCIKGGDLHDTNK